MFSFTVYLSFMSDSFRVVAGEHKRHEGADSSNWTVHVYQGTDLQQAAHAAYHGETRADVKTQIARFLTTSPRERVKPKTHGHGCTCADCETKRQQRVPRAIPGDSDIPPYRPTLANDPWEEGFGGDAILDRNIN